MGAIEIRDSHFLPGTATCNMYHKVWLAIDVGTAIRKSIVVLFLPCLVAFLGFHPYMVPHLFFCNLFLLFFWGGEMFHAEMCCCKS